MISSRTKKIKYAIRELEMGAKPGTIKLNIGDPLAYDLKLPEIMAKALVEAINEGHSSYSDSQGIGELREKISKKENVSPENVIITSGTSEAINFIFASILNRGDKVLLPTPCYPQYPSIVELWEGKPVFYGCDENWIPDVSEIKKKSKDIKALVMINPNNPTGAVYPKDIIEEICTICERNRILLISDEIYSDLTFEEKFFPVKDISSSETIALNGISKCYLAPGWRIGWATFHNFRDNKLKESILKLCRLRLCASTPLQYAVSKVIDEEFRFGKVYLDEVKRKLQRRRDFMMSKFKEYKIDCALPKGTFYAFPSIGKDKRWKNDLDFVLKLRDEMKVLVVHGGGFFYRSKDIYFRIVFLPNEKMLGEAIDRIGKFISG
jgi:alanine-synthesizing transaminase